MSSTTGTQEGLDLEKQSHLDLSFGFCGHIGFILWSTGWISLPVLATQQDLTSIPSLNLTDISDSHIQTERQDLNILCTASWFCWKKAYSRVGYLQLRSPRTGKILRESQNTTRREQFAYLTASISSWIRLWWKELGETQFFWTKLKVDKFAMAFWFPVLLVKAPEMCFPVAREWPPRNPDQTTKNPGTQLEQIREVNWYVWHLAFTTSKRETSQEQMNKEGEMVKCGS